MYAKKSLGQHFLHSDSDLSEIVRAANINDCDLVLEIGPGKGALTKKLLKVSNKIVAIEKDDELFENLKEVFKEDIDNGKLEIIHGDILEFDTNNLKTSNNLNYKIVANIPYNITGGILKKFLSAEKIPERIALLVQKEVAERYANKFVAFRTVLEIV